MNHLRLVPPAPDDDATEFVYQDDPDAVFVLHHEPDGTLREETVIPTAFIQKARAQSVINIYDHGDGTGRADYVDPKGRRLETYRREPLKMSDRGIEWPGGLFLSYEDETLNSVHATLSAAEEVCEESVLQLVKTDAHEPAPEDLFLEPGPVPGCQCRHCKRERHLTS